MNENKNENEYYVGDANISKNNNQVINQKYMGRKNGNLAMIILLLISIVSIAYAVLSTSLHLNGGAEIKPMKWDIHFENVIEKEESIEAKSPAKILSNSTTVQFGVKFLVPGEEYSFNVDVVNDGTIDAMLNIYSTNGLNEEASKYVDYTVTYADGTPLKAKDLIKAGNKETLTITVKNKDILMSENDLDLTLNFDCNYIQADKTAVERATE